MEDVIIVGGGVCGCSLLYELSRYNLKTLLIEKENDISVGTTKGNSDIVHAGYDPEPGTKMA
jgi:glycerol-3-phosphate dehydrogenase